MFRQGVQIFYCLSASIRLRNSDLTLDSLVPAHLSRDQFELALLLKHYQIGLWGQPRRDGAKGLRS